MFKRLLIWLSGLLPKRKVCAWCGRPFLAAPIEGGHEDYCSIGCSAIQGQIDDWENHILAERERELLERFEHPTDL